MIGSIEQKSESTAHSSNLPINVFYFASWPVSWPVQFWAICSSKMFRLVAKILKIWHKFWFLGSSWKITREKNKGKLGQFSKWLYHWKGQWLSLQRKPHTPVYHSSPLHTFPNSKTQISHMIIAMLSFYPFIFTCLGPAGKEFVLTCTEFKP